MAQYTCIVCPNSCLINVEQRENGLEITGNKCRRGKEFAQNEHEHPRRMFTSTVKVEGARIPRISVISSAEIPKNKMFECQRELSSVVAHAPIQCGDILVENICGTGVNLVASRTLEAI